MSGIRHIGAAQSVDELQGRAVGGMLLALELPQVLHRHRGGVQALEDYAPRALGGRLLAYQDAAAVAVAEPPDQDPSDPEPPADEPPLVEYDPAAGWHALWPSADSRLIYVDPEGGSDAAADPHVWSEADWDDPLDPPADLTPFRTIDAAKNRLRHGEPDWLLLRGNRTFAESGTWLFGDRWRYGGKSEAEPMVCTIYGPRKRPVLKNGRLATLGGGSSPNSPSHVRWRGLEFYASRKDPAHVDFDRQFDTFRAIDYKKSGEEDLLFEDLVTRFYREDIVQAIGSVITGFRFHRCIHVDHWHKNRPLGAESQGIWCGGSDGGLVKNYAITECFLDRNGWNPDLWEQLGGFFSDLVQTDLDTWRSVGDGVFRLQLNDGSWHEVTQLDFTSVQSLEGVVQVIEDGVNAAQSTYTASLAHTTYSVNAFDAIRWPEDASGNYVRELDESTEPGTSIASWINYDGQGLRSVGGRTAYNHNLYLAGSGENVRVHGNILARGSSHGCQLRPGGYFTRNLVARNAIGWFIGSGFARGSQNLTMESDDIDPGMGPGTGSRGWGIEMFRNNDGRYEDNLVLDRVSPSNQAGMFSTRSPKPGEPPVQVHRNVIRGWSHTDGEAIRLTDENEGDFDLKQNIADGAYIATGEDAGQPDPDLTLDDVLDGGFAALVEHHRAREAGQWDPAFSASHLYEQMAAALVVDPPPALASGALSVVSKTASSVTLTGTAPTGGLEPYENELEVSEDDGQSWTSLGAIEPGTEHVVDGLVEGATYRFRVLTTDGNDEIALGEQLEVTPQEAVVPGTPGMIRGVVRSSLVRSIVRAVVEEASS